MVGILTLKSTPLFLELDLTFMLDYDFFDVAVDCAWRTFGEAIYANLVLPPY